MTPLFLKRASASRSSGQWSDDDYDVLENGVVVGRIFHLQAAAPEGRPRMSASATRGTSSVPRAVMRPPARRRWRPFAKSWWSGELRGRF